MPCVYPQLSQTANFLSAVFLGGLGGGGGGSIHLSITELVKKDAHSVLCVLVYLTL